MNTVVPPHSTEAAGCGQPAGRQATPLHDVYTHRSVSLDALDALASLRTELPDYYVIMTNGGGRFRYEAIRLNGDGPWCVISSDPRDLWRELCTGRTS